jgi:hypothetical protein
VSVWVVPGHVLPRGEGWVIWYSQMGVGHFTPPAPEISQNGQSVPLQPLAQPVQLGPVDGRYFALQTVRLQHPNPGSTYTIRFPSLPQISPLRWRTMPDSLPSEGVSFLLGSCFWRNDDKEGSYSAAVRTLTQKYTPVFKLLVGDQVYQDYPSAIGHSAPHFQYAERYSAYWGDPAYQEVLRACPNYFVGDDHEFWNDYPERQSFIPYTFTQASRDARGQAAAALYKLYQTSLNPSPGPWFKFSVAGVQFFVADTRSDREKCDGSSAKFMSGAQWKDLEDWFDSLTGPGVLVLGQPMFLKDGDWKDHSLSNFENEFDRLCMLIKQRYRGKKRDNSIASDGKPHQILMLSGDIHHGRFTSMQVLGVPGPNDEIHEFVSSAACKIRPDLSFSSPDPAPDKIPPSANFPYFKKTFQSSLYEENNLGAITMKPVAGGVKFKFDLWRVRRATSWNPFQGLFSTPEPDLKELYSISRKLV